MAEPLPAFVARRKPEWTRLETMLGQQRARQLTLADLSELDALYRRTSADLAFAQSSYAGTDVLRFLNQLCARAYAAIYRPRGMALESLRTFYGQTFPRLVRQTLPMTQLAAALLFFGIVVGALTVILWKLVAVDSMGSALYEIVPGFIAASVAIVIGSLLSRVPSAEVQARHQQVQLSLREQGY